MDKLRGRNIPGGTAGHFARAARAPHRVAVALGRKLLVPDRPARRWRLRAMFATESRFENRVTLGSARDSLGRPVARVEWRLGDDDLRSMRRGAALMDAALGRAGHGGLELAFPDQPSAWRAAAVGGKHQLGATRMHPDPARGVVDEHGRVHGVGNLYLTGSSVFPYGGYANPTLTIVALAVRLAEHLRGG
jgi:choline dehydrogenase-like flavoprotein